MDSRPMTLSENPSASTPLPLDPLITEAELQTRIRALAAEINAVYRGVEKITIIAVLKGSFMFLADLVRHLEHPCQVEFVRLASYGEGTQSSGTVRPVDLTLPELTGHDVLLVEDIIDTGLTLHFFRDYLASLHQPRSLRLAVLLDKPAARTHGVPVDFTGFTIGNEFVVGYGLDFAGLYRNLPYIGVVRTAEQSADALS